MQISIRTTALPLALFVLLATACSSLPDTNEVTTSRYAVKSYQNAEQDHRAAPTAISPATFGSPLAAVLAAGNEYNPLSIAQDREFIGAILRQHDVYRYTVGHGMSGQDTVSVRLVVPHGAEIVAFWHTHGAGGHGRRYFSAVDTGLVESWNKPFYLTDHSGTLRVFRPGDSTIGALQAERLGLGKRAGYAKGSKVLLKNGRQAQVATNVLAQS